MKNLFTIVLLFFIIANSHAQVSITSASFSYNQDFDGLANSGANTWTNNSTIPGWYASLTSYTGNNGSSTSGALYSYGSTGATERALGAINTNAIGTIYYGLRLVNNSSFPVTSLTVSFDGEQWRDQDAADQSVTFSYQIGATVTSLTSGTWTSVNELTFTSPVSISSNQLDGNLAANRTAGISTTISLNIPVGQEVMLRWLDNNAANSDHGLAIDNFSISSITLPVSLTSFTVKATPVPFLEWQTATERNNSHFEIERSVDGTVFEKIGEVAGKGTSVEVSNYTFEDKAPLSGVNYYRLRQVDFDGAFEYSAVRSVVFGSTKKVTVFPAPAAAVMTVQLDEAFKNDAQWQITDMAGRVVAEGVFVAEQNQLDIPVNALSEGVYVLRIVADQETITRQFRKI